MCLACPTTALEQTGFGIREANVLYSCQRPKPHTQQMAQVICLFLRQTDYCNKTAACHKAMLAGVSNSGGLHWQSRLAKRCTWAECPRLAGAALGVFPRPTCAIWCLVCLCWRSGEIRAQEGRGAWCSDLARVLMLMICNKQIRLSSQVGLYTHNVHTRTPTYTHRPL